MTDTALNRYLMEGTAAARAAYTPTPASPAAGPALAPLWFETDTGKLYAWNSSTTQWVLVSGTSGGGGSTPVTPVVRATSHLVQNAASYVVTLPAGAAKGDLCLAFCENGYGWNTPAGWTLIDQHTGTCNGAVFSRVLTSADITTGTATFSPTNAYNGSVCLVCMTGVPAGPPYTRTFAAALTSTGTTQVVHTDGSPLTTDYALVYTGLRGADTPANSFGASLDSGSDASQAGFRVSGGVPTSNDMVTNTSTFSSGDATYTAVLVLRSI